VGLPLSRKQIAAIVGNEDARITVLEGAVRSGKTFATNLRFFRMVSRAPATGLILIVGRTLQTIERNILEPMADEALFGPLAATVTHTRGASTAKIMGREVHLIGAADARAETKLRGLTACLALADEATLLPEEFWVQLLARLSVPGAQLLATTNPGSPRHWLKTGFLDRADNPDLSLARYHFTLDDNPSLTREYVAALKAANRGLFYKRNVQGLWVSAEGAIYEEWDEDTHVVADADLPPMDRVLACGIDYGTTNATRGYLLGLARDPDTGRHGLYVLDEWAPTRSTDAALSKSLREWLAERPAPEWVAVDPAAASFKLQLFGDGVGNVMNAPNAVVDGIRVVKSVLASGDLHVSSTCEHLIRWFPEYAWDAKAAERGQDAPIKRDDHEVDALRYAIVSTRHLWSPYLAANPTRAHAAA
jgi:PBSX family phage terminase large subunit